MIVLQLFNYYVRWLLYTCKTTHFNPNKINALIEEERAAGRNNSRARDIHTAASTMSG